MRKVCMLGWLLGLTLVGCAMDGPASATGSWSRYRPRLPGVTPHGVELHYLFLEIPSTEAAVDDSLWLDTDEQVVPLDQKQRLRAEGLRIAKVGARLPSSVSRLMERNRQRSEPRCHLTHSGELFHLETTPVRDTLQLTSAGTELPTWTHAQGYFNLTPILVEGNAIRLEIYPEFEHGERIRSAAPSPDLSGWMVKNERETHAFDRLKVTLEAETGEYFMLGSWRDLPQSVGRALFDPPADTPGNRRILLVRVVRPTREQLLTAGYDYDDFFLSPIERQRVGAKSMATMTAIAARRPAPAVKPTPLP